MSRAKEILDQVSEETQRAEIAKDYSDILKKFDDARESILKQMKELKSETYTRTRKLQNKSTESKDGKVKEIESFYSMILDNDLYAMDQLTKRMRDFKTAREKWVKK
jgi:hypothetical protein